MTGHGKLETLAGALRCMRAALLVLLLIPLAGAQDHEHGEAGPVIIATDLGPAMVAHVGSPVHFALVALGDDLDPDFHVDLPVRVSLNNVTLWETTALSGHDYDGINALDVIFPVAGDWEVAYLKDGAVAHSIHGTVIEAPLRAAQLLLSGPATAAVGDAASFMLELTDNGRVNHTDAVFEVYKAGELWFRTHTHTHTEAQALKLAFTEPGTYDIRVLGYTAFPGSAASVAPVLAMHQVVVSANPARTPSLPATDQPTAKNAVVHGTAEAPYQLIGTFDPFTIVGQRTIQHLNAMVIDPETRMPVQHVDFTATLTGPGGVLFSSETLHEYDGIFELALRSSDLGTHVLTLTASRGDWQGSMTMTYTVAPPVQANVFGPQDVRLTMPAVQSGVPAAAMFQILGVGDRPFAHGEIEVDLRDAAGISLIRNKLHTHALGDFPFTFSTAGAGDHVLIASPFPLDPQPVTAFSRLDFAVAVVEGPGIPVPIVSVPPVDAATPGAPIALVVALLGFAALRRR